MAAKPITDKTNKNRRLHTLEFGGFFMHAVASGMRTRIDNEDLNRGQKTHDI